MPIIYSYNTKKMFANSKYWVNMYQQRIDRSRKSWCQITSRSFGRKVIWDQIRSRFEKVIWSDLNWSEINRSFSDHFEKKYYRKNKKFPHLLSLILNHHEYPLEPNGYPRTSLISMTLLCTHQRLICSKIYRLFFILWLLEN